MSGEAAEEPRTGVRFPFSEPERGEAVEVAPGVLWTRIGLPSRLNHVNVYLLDEGEGRGWTVVDTGLRHKMCLEDWAKLEEGPLRGKGVERVIATHHHSDHIGLAGRFMRDHGAELWTTRTAWLNARMLQLDHQEAHTPEQLRHWERGGVPADMVAEFVKDGPFNTSISTWRLPLGYRRIIEGEEIAAGGRRWIARMGDGHAPEHATFWSMDDNLVIVGDQAIPGISSNLGVHPTEPEADPVGEWLDSCEKLLAFAREDHVAMPGHKAVYTGLPTRFRQLISNHHGAIKRLREHLKAPRTASQCFVPLFGREIPAAVYRLALNEALGHLNHMRRSGEAVRELGEDGAFWWRLAR